MAHGSRQRNRAPVYSADTLAWRMIGGLALIALGVVILLGAGLRMQGAVFEGVRRVCGGLTGGLTLILPAFPIWAGVLLILSTQRKAPTRPLLFAFLAYLGACAFVVLVTRVGQQSYLEYLTGNPARGWGDVIRLAFETGSGRSLSGGALGVLLAWPLWQLAGDVLAIAVTLILTVLCALLAVNLTPKKIYGLLSGKVSLRKHDADREQATQEQIAWQQEQARRQQMAAWQAQQQSAAMGQQGGMAYPAGGPAVIQGTGTVSGEDSQAYGAAGAAVPGNGSGIPYTASDPSLSQDQLGVEDWQAQLSQRMAASGSASGKDSRIFNRQEKQSEKSEKKSWIFSRRKDEDDGLTDASPEEKERAGLFSGRKQGRQATGQEEETEQDGDPIRVFGRKPGRQEPQEFAKENGGASLPGRNQNRPQTRWNAADQDEDVQEIYNQAKQANRAGREDAGQRETAEKTVVAQAGQEPKAENPQARNESKIAVDSRSAGDRGKTGKPEEGRQTTWAEQLEMAQREAEKAIPNAQQRIGEKTWKPELKGVAPKEEEEEPWWEPTPYVYPPITDLAKPKPADIDTAAEDGIRSQRLEEILASFNVPARVVNVTHGPAISRFEMELASGTKVSKVAGLEKDIAYGMEATSVRIEAPIPGKGLVGVEVPNKKIATVTLREVLESPAMQNATSILTVALGKDIAGTPVVCDLAKMPHVLIAGATGSGKSVCINTIINSLLYRAGPDEVKLILVDPKVVELQCYNGIPHLLLPVVNDPHKAAAALAWAVAEMMERYDKFAERGVRNLDGFNRTLEAGEKPMPRIVIIIDELADLMMVCKKDVEEYIARLTQLARAAGIHLIVATQRPSVDVITGLIKANIPSRIAFKTASYVDSRTILDRNGSEQLLGWGDMLYLPTGSFAPTRIQGCFLSDDEVNRIADHVRANNPCSYDPDILDRVKQLESGGEDAPGMDVIGGIQDAADNDKDLFEQAVEYAIADGQISTSTLQRRLKVGYARAGRLTDEMEERGIVAAKDGSKPRKCLITREQWEEIKKTTEGVN